MLLKNPPLIDEKTGFSSTLNFPEFQKQTNVTKKCPFCVSQMLPLISRLLPAGVKLTCKLQVSLYLQNTK